jgi:alpha-tubulin suppressor-like RCC1 family protein
MFAASRWLWLVFPWLLGGCTERIPRGQDDGRSGAEDSTAPYHEGSDSGGGAEASGGFDAENVDGRVTGDATTDVSDVDATTLDATTLDATTLDATALDATTLDATTLDVAALDATTLDATALDATALDATAPDVISEDSGTGDAAGAGLGLTTANATCARRSNGTVACWGLNSAGQLGDGTMVNSSRPVAVRGITDATALGIGVLNGHNCVVRAGGTVWCWGTSVSGVLGNVTVTGSWTTTPVQVLDIVDAVEVGVGGQHTCARRANGTVACWGSGVFYWSLGDPSVMISYRPVQVVGLDQAVELSVGANHSCARRVDGTVVCWGFNSYGGVGNGAVSVRAAPSRVLGVSDAVEVAAGQQHSCARRANGTVVCWGGNSFGQLGAGSAAGAMALSPVAVVGLTDAVEVAAGHFHTCARRAGGSVVCWGVNVNGQLGAGSAVGMMALSPVAVAGLTDAVEIAAGYAGSCARRANGSYVCWGDNTYGQLGDGTRTNSSVPVAVLAGP